MGEKYYAFERQRRETIHLKSPPKLAKPKAWSHDDDLHANIGKTITVEFSTGAITNYAILLDADRYTLKVLYGQSIVTIFKHAILGYLFPIKE